MKSLIMFLAPLALGTAAQAESIEVTATPQVARVSIVDVNLNSQVGRALAQRRIHSAAAKVCANDGVRDVFTRLATHDCISQAVSEGNRQLFARYDGTRLAQASVTVRGY